jgi:hypothetical protein
MKAYPPVGEKIEVSETGIQVSVAVIALVRRGEAGVGVAAAVLGVFVARLVGSGVFVAVLAGTDVVGGVGVGERGDVGGPSEIKLARAKPRSLKASTGEGGGLRRTFPPLDRQHHRD